MNSKLSKADKELYRRIDEVLFYHWDPIGVSDEPYARDEYDSYTGRVFSKMKSGANEQDITDLLLGIMSDMMGMKRSEKLEKHCSEVSEILIRNCSCLI